VPTAVLIAIPGGDAAMYDRADELGRQRGPAHPDGLIHHFAGQAGDNFIIFDIWDSADHFQNYAREVIGPVMTELSSGTPPPIEPTIFELHAELHRERSERSH
jgi:hypothetical protein